MAKSKLTAEELKTLMNEVENGFNNVNDLRKGQKHIEQYSSLRDILNALPQ